MIELYILVPAVISTTGPFIDRGPWLESGTRLCISALILTEIQHSDCPIAQKAMDHGAALLHNDRECRCITYVSSLRIFTSAAL